jgi:hypothetical protein
MDCPASWASSARRSLPRVLAFTVVIVALVVALLPNSPPGVFVHENIFGLRRRSGAPALRIAAASCDRNFDVSSGFGPNGPRLWLWWTAAEAVGPPDARYPTGSGWMMRECLDSMRRHAEPLLRISIVNSSATRGANAPYRLRRFPLPSYFDDLPINHQGDFGSFALLAEFGGVYLDTDMLLLHGIGAHLRLLERFEFVGFGGHSGDRGVHHGLMAARPRSEVLMRTYRSALTVYAELGGCSGVTCAHREKLGWLATLEAFSREAAAMQLGSGAAAAASCRYARLPTRHFEPGTREHESMCLPAYETVFRGAHAGAFDLAAGGPPAPAEAAHYVSAVLQAALLGSLRVLHLSPTKYEYASRFPGWREAPRLEHCPLLHFLLNMSEGRTDLALAQRVGFGNVDVFEQQEGDFWPGRLI